MSELLSIGEVAAKLNVSPHTLRYYERAGLLKAVERTDGNARRYSPQAVELIWLLRKLRETGMPIARMKQYTDLIADGHGTVEARKKILQQHRESLKSQINALEQCVTIVDAKLEIYESGCSMENADHPAVKKLASLFKENQK